MVPGFKHARGLEKSVTMNTDNASEKLSGEVFTVDMMRDVSGWGGGAFCYL